MKRNRHKTLVECLDCKISYEKRTDTLKNWNNLCRICSSRKTINEKIKGIKRVVYKKCKNCNKESRWIKNSELCQLCFSKISGENHHNYKKDRSSLSKKQERNDSSYREWRANVWKRDGYTCQLKNEECCNKIEAHHVYEWIKYGGLRYDVNNGITLCRVHHPKKKEQVILLREVFNKIINLKK